jgi:hypothetical protein
MREDRQLSVVRGPFLLTQSAERKAQSVKGKNRPVGASSACDKTCGRNLSYRNEDVAPTYRPMLYALCFLVLDFNSLINQNGKRMCSWFTRQSG